MRDRSDYFGAETPPLHPFHHFAQNTSKADWPVVSWVPLTPLLEYRAEVFSGMVNEAASLAVSEATSPIVNEKQKIPLYHSYITKDSNLASSRGPISCLI